MRENALMNITQALPVLAKAEREQGPVDHVKRDHKYYTQTKQCEYEEFQYKNHLICIYFRTDWDYLGCDSRKSPYCAGIYAVDTYNDLTKDWSDKYIDAADLPLDVYKDLIELVDNYLTDMHECARFGAE